jgi:hypothetical protein
MYTGLRVRYPLFLADFKGNLIFWVRFFKNIPNFMKICPVGAELFQADRQTDRHETADSRFSQLFERA